MGKAPSGAFNGGGQHTLTQAAADAKRNKGSMPLLLRVLARAQPAVKPAAVVEVDPGVVATAVDVWSEVTDGQGVVLVNGREVPARRR